MGANYAEYLQHDYGGCPPPPPAHPPLYCKEGSISFDVPEAWKTIYPNLYGNDTEDMVRYGAAWQPSSGTETSIARNRSSQHGICQPASVSDAELQDYLRVLSARRASVQKAFQGKTAKEVFSTGLA